MITAEYRKKLVAGLEYQDFVVECLYAAGLPIISYSSKRYQTLIGENKAGLEIKFDRRFRTTHNFWIETAEKSRPDNPRWVPSGIFRDDNTWLYLMGDYVEIFVFAKRQLRWLYEWDTDGRPHYPRKDIPTSRGFLLPVDDARKRWAVHVLETAPLGVTSPQSTKEG